MYLPAVKQVPLAAPNVEQATATGMSQAMTPSVRLAKVCRNNPPHHARTVWGPRWGRRVVVCEKERRGGRDKWKQKEKRLGKSTATGRTSDARIIINEVTISLTCNNGKLNILLLCNILQFMTCYFSFGQSV